MSLKFTFGGGAPGNSGHDHDEHDGHGHGGATPGIPLPFAGAASSGQPISTSSILEIRVTRGTGAAAPTDGTANTSAVAAELVIAEALSGDGVSYGRAEKSITAGDAASLGSAARSVIARVGATLPEPLIGSVSAVVLSFGADGTEVLASLGIANSAVDEALQARTGLSAGTPIRIE